MSDIIGSEPNIVHVSPEALLKETNEALQKIAKKYPSVAFIVLVGPKSDASALRALGDGPRRVRPRGLRAQGTRRRRALRSSSTAGRRRACGRWCSTSRTGSATARRTGASRRRPARAREDRVEGVDRLVAAALLPLPPGLLHLDHGRQPQVEPLEGARLLAAVLAAAHSRLFEHKAEEIIARGDDAEGRPLGKIWWLRARSFPQEADKEKQAETLAGLHADSVSILLDEVGSFPMGVFDAAKAIFNVKGVDALLVASGNATTVDGPLYYIFTEELISGSSSRSPATRTTRTARRASTSRRPARRSQARPQRPGRDGEHPREVPASRRQQAARRRGRSSRRR
jgi:hypothetical protein